ncbi:nitrate reductase molybdenum cofactor assembly chaperone [Ciceribacter ferrooxidans]|uniref:Nitrate reductase molybdenum cofactor assembly chaperone n=1 Tax=Ciceribacter ferrooxidans TaxID=2509717 RepID=A0A4Q2TXF3_9HYPH|nr:nitrate reductase molybdenum cofactor assembly chaperone [Ciceribacter ferrooxidans]RYC26309.1 nitrate reductase molybdenum cofactor assembly chaperone [Ciceribacter ferrooxidans]
MHKALKIISLLLSYPSDELLAGAPELKSALDGDDTIAREVKLLLGRLLDDLAGQDLYDAQERYVYLFDRSRSLSLHLFEHVHGESRDRGQAMVDLMTMYEDNGFVIDAKELPDYLPLFLEFLSTRSVEEVDDLLAQTAHITAALGERLKKRQSVYADPFLALRLLSKTTPDQKLLKELLDGAEDDPNDLSALDRIWEDEAVTFGGNAGDNSCGPDRLRTQMRAAARKPNDPLNTIPV